MRNGDISNATEPRLLVVFEGLIARQDTGMKQVVRSMGRRAGKNRRLIRDLVLNDKAVRAVTDVVYRYNYTVDIVTFMPDEFTAHIEAYLDDFSVPYSRLVQADRHVLSRNLIYRPDIIGVFFPDPHDVLVFGSKGYLVNPDAPILMGQL